MGSIFKRGKTWYINYRYKGRRMRKKIATSKKVAELTLKDVEIKIAKREYLGIYDDRKILFKDFQKDYLEKAEGSKAKTTIRREKEIINKNLMPFFEDYFLPKITPYAWETYQTQRLKNVSPITVNKEFAILRHILNKAVEWKYIKENSLKGLKKLKEPPGRLRYLDGKDLNSVISSCPKWLHPIIIIALYSGMRRSEILKLKWSDIDFNLKTITLTETKSGERRIIPISEKLFDLLNTLPGWRKEEKVFPNINGNMVTMAFRRACRNASIKDFRFHDLRHTFASQLAMRGVTERFLQELLGHKDPRMTKRYSHLSNEALKRAVDKLDDLGI